MSLYWCKWAFGIVLGYYTIKFGSKQAHSARDVLAVRVLLLCGWGWRRSVSRSMWIENDFTSIQGRRSWGAQYFAEGAMHQSGPPNPIIKVQHVLPCQSVIKIMKCPCLNCHKFGQLIIRKIFRIIATINVKFWGVKMYTIRFRVGLRPRPHWRSLQRSPDPLAAFKGPYF